MCPVQRALAPAKVNLHLGIHSQKDDRGYHRADSVMVTLSLADVVEVREGRGLLVRMEPAIDLPNEKNTAWRAARLLADELGIEPNVDIRVEKHVPEKGGLGGSSTDAGAVLRLLAARWGVSADDERVVAVARRVGADVAFFLQGGAACLAGAGDVLVEQFPQVPQMHLVLAMPACEGVSTPAAYAEFDRVPVDPADVGPMQEALRSGDADAVAGLLHNNLAPAAIRLCPAVGECAAWLSAQEGVIAAQVTGSGACSFAVVGDEGAAECVARAAQARGWWAKPVTTVGFASDFC